MDYKFDRPSVCKVPCKHVAVTLFSNWSVKILTTIEMFTKCQTRSKSFISLQIYNGLLSEDGLSHADKLPNDEMHAYNTKEVPVPLQSETDSTGSNR